MYTIVIADNVDALVASVNAKRTEGFVTVGGIAVAVGSLSHVQFMQAMEMPSTECFEPQAINIQTYDQWPEAPIADSEGHSTSFAERVLAAHKENPSQVRHRKKAKKTP